MIDVGRQPELLSSRALRHKHAEAGHPMQHGTSAVGLRLLGAKGRADKGPSAYPVDSAAYNIL